MSALFPGQWCRFSFEASGLRLDIYLSRRFPELSRARVQKLIEDGFVKCDGIEAKSNLKPKEGSWIELFLPEPKLVDLVAQEIPLKIYYQDIHLAVIEKPAGLVIHPAAGHSEGTLVNALLHHFKNLSESKGIGGELRPGIVHRIDKNTSGVLLITKSDIAHRSLSLQFKEHSISRKYKGLCWGELPPEGKWDAAIARDPKERKRMALRPEGRKALTHFRRQDSFFRSLSLFEAELFTGRTHQIRVHFAAHGYPLVGDGVYGSAYRSGRQKKEAGFRLLQKKCEEAYSGIEIIQRESRQFLHASHLGFSHPVSGSWMEFESPLPADLEKIVLSLKKCSKK